MHTQHIIYGGLAFLATFGGACLPLIWAGPGGKRVKVFANVGAGILLGMSLLHMMPASAEILPNTFSGWFLGGFLILFGLERFVMIHSCEEHGCNYHTIGLGAFFGLAVHSFFDGLALMSSFHGTHMGEMVLMAVLAHKVPAGFTLASLLKLAGYSSRQILLFSCGVAIATPLGMGIVGFLVAEGQAPNITGILLALSAGTFLYIAACDLIPEFHQKEGRGGRTVFFLAGIGLSVLATFLE